MDYYLRKANLEDATEIWIILQQAIARRKKDNSTQWQDGYPNPKVIHSDILKNVGFVLIKDKRIIGYCAILINDEPEYKNIEGKWITNDDFVVFHRIAIEDNFLRKGFAEKIMQFIEDYALENNISSIKVDTSFDNTGMLKLFDKFAYSYCGEVHFRGSPRQAFEKVLIG